MPVNAVLEAADKTEMLILNLAVVALVGKGAWQQMEEKGFVEKLEEEKTVKLGKTRQRVLGTKFGAGFSEKS